MENMEWAHQRKFRNRGLSEWTGDLMDDCCLFRYEHLFPAIDVGGKRLTKLQMSDVPIGSSRRSA
jgi:hypothetical protein